MSRLFLTLCCTLLLLALACQKEKPIDYTRYPNILTCKVDGKPWAPTRNGSFLQNNLFRFSLYYVRNIFSGQGERFDEDTNLSFSIQSFGVGQRPLIWPSRVGWRDLKKNKNGRCWEYQLDSLSPYHFTVHQIDTLNGVIKASFDFYLENDCGEHVHITEGRMDVRANWFPE